MTSTWNDLSKLLLIREYQLRPYLYEEGHNSRIERQRGISEVADVLSANGSNFTATQISAQLRYLKVTYKKHLLKMEQDRLDGKPVSLPSWKFFKHLKFLGDLDAFNEDMRSVSAPKSTSQPRPATPHVQRKVNRTRNKTPAANQTLATQIPSHAIIQSRAKSVHRPAVGRPVVNWAANQEAVTSLLNETKPYYLHGAAARRAVSCPKRPQIEPESAQHNQTTVKIEAVALWSNYDYTLENNGFGQGFGLTPQSQRMAQLRRCTVDLSPAAENEQDSTTEGDDDEANDVAVVDDSEEDPDFKHFGLFYYWLK
ncbi:alcohol dehydrogenase transcription factor myb/SANT-like domain-containing protein [Ditylenchus destructor]|uniref:Alcohol dehydrogenase transcription factor myb/SANT-like domain-containing protein n=1 Tax=Ditylenchus destructor TaxID=166010 RepID=A0AAD4MEW3_9BILA|nr:alcohol dehydrogenase transcription factor myb/SANT-like domain-containing protein [Ditylenchus destructor]